MADDKNSAVQLSRFLAVLMLLCIARQGAADTLVLQDGSRLLGEVVSQEDGVLKFSTGFAGVISVQWDQVQELQADKPVEVYLGDDGSVQATTVRRTDNGIELGATDGAVRQLPASAPAVINPEPWQRGDGAKLTGRINAGLEFQKGNTDQEKLALDAELKARRKHDRTTFISLYQKDKTDEITTARNWLLSGKYDYFVTEKWYYGGSLKFEQDRFADLRLRSTAGPHVGYQFIESERMNLGTDVSLLYLDQDYYEAEDEESAALGWSVDFDWMVYKDRIQFYHRHSGYVEPEETENVVVDSWTGFRFPLVAGVVASTEAQIEYDGGAPSDVDKVDTIYRAKLGYQW